MHIQPLTQKDNSAWADLLAIAFDRQPTEMQQLLAWFQASEGLLAWGAWHCLGGDIL